MADSPEPIDPEIVRLQSLIFEHRLVLNRVLNRAGLKRSTWRGWVHGAVPRLPNLRRLEGAIDAMIAEKERPHGK